MWTSVQHGILSWRLRESLFADWIFFLCHSPIKLKCNVVLWWACWTRGCDAGINSLGDIGPITLLWLNLPCLPVGIKKKWEQRDVQAAYAPWRKGGVNVLYLFLLFIYYLSSGDNVAHVKKFKIQWNKATLTFSDCGRKGNSPLSLHTLD